MSDTAETLDAWNEKFGDVKLFADKPSGKGYEFEMDVAYPCKITKATCLISKYDSTQIELQFDVQAHDGEGDDVPSVGKSRVWLDLPKQKSDINKDRETVITLTQRRFENLMRVLAAAAPARFALYAERQGSAKPFTFIDFDGEKMTSADLNSRAEEIQSNCVTFVDGLTVDQDIELLQDTLLYIEKRRNPRNEKYPYVNYYGSRPTRTKVFGDDSSNTPF